MTTRHATDRSKWQEVTAAEPCPVCEKPNLCRRSPDGSKIACRRESRGAVEVKKYKDGSEAYIHDLQLNGPQDANERPNAKRQRKTSGGTPTPSDGSMLQDSPTPSDNAQDAAGRRDAGYRRLLATLPLSLDHRDDLKHRGLSDTDIDAGGYKTLPAAGRATFVKQVAAELGQDFAAVPGFVMGERGPRIAAPAGLLVPVRDLAGRIGALKLRADNPPPGKPKYVYLSSARYGGPSPGSPAHVPAGVFGPVDVVRITEGELKADVATRLSGLPTVSFSGVASWRVVLPVLQNLQAKTVRVAFDADAGTNKHVAKGLCDCCQVLQAAGFRVELERWPADAGKGIDDVLAAGRGAEIEVLAGPAALQAAEEIAAAAGVDQDPMAAKMPNEAVDDPHRLARLHIERYETHDGQQTLVFWRDSFHRWDGIAYRPVQTAEITAELTRLAKSEFDAENRAALEQYEALAKAGMIAPERDKGPPRCRKVTRAIISNVVHALESETLLPGDIEQPAWLGDDEPFPATEVLATDAALLHLPSLTTDEPCLLKPTPEFFSANALPYGFDPEAGCPEWMRFLGTLWPDDPQSIATLGEWFGYSLLPDTRQHKLLMLVGPPRSGKGTIARVLREVIGPQNLASPTLGSLAGPFGLQPLLGKLVALVADARLSGRMDAIVVVERLLSISGEDPQDVARKNMTTLTGIKLPARFLIMTNELPNMRDSSGALMTRVILLRLTRTFQGKEDKGLISKLLAELPGILNWSIRGWQRLNERGGFLQPDSGRELLDDLTDLASPVRAFVQDACILGPEFETPLSELFDKWREWCGSHGRDEPGILEWFAKDLRAAYPAIAKIRRRARLSSSAERRETVYGGIGLR